MRTAKVLLPLAAAATLALVAYAQTAAARTISAAQAKRHIGERATVCGVVVSTKYAASSRGRPTFLNLDKPYPNQIFTVVIWGRDRKKFGQPEEKYRHKRICVTGIIRSYRGVPEIVAREPEQIKMPSEAAETAAAPRAEHPQMSENDACPTLGRIQYAVRRSG